MDSFPPYRKVLLDHYLDQPENTVGIEFSRDHDHDPETSFSTDVYEELVDQLLAFVASRVMRHYNHRGRAAKRMRIDIRAEVTQ
jgi:hypothetical protein